MRKIFSIILGILFFVILFIFSTNSILITTFSNGNQIENLTFTGNQNISRNLSISRYVNVTSSYMNLSGYNYTSSCYQETTNSSTVSDGNCNLNYSGTYAVDESLSYSAFVYINYSKPNTALSGIWKVKADDYNEYFVIPNDCWNYNNFVNLRMHSSVSGSGKFTNIACFNSTDWKILNDTWQSACNNAPSPDGTWIDIIDGNWSSGVVRGACGAGGGTGNWRRNANLMASLYEEAMIWNITAVYPNNPSLSINNTQIWNFTGEFSQTNNKTLDFSSTLNTALNNGKCDCSGCSLIGNNCTIQITFHSDSIGILQYSDIQINYDPIPFVYLISPSNATYSSLTKSFTCNTTDEINLKNVTLYIWNSTNSVINNTISTSNVSNHYIFNGVNSEIFIKNSIGSYTNPFNFNISNNFTFSFWFKPSDFVFATYIGNPILQIADSSGINLIIGYQNNLSVFTWNGTKGIKINSNQTLSLNQWYFGSIVYSSNSSINIYLNGTLVGSDNLPKMIACDTYTEIGQENCLDADLFYGSMDEVRIYNISLSQENITTLYNFGRFNESIGSISNGLIGMYHFNNKDVATDSSGNDNNGNLTAGGGSLSFISLIELTTPLITFPATDTYKWNCLAYNNNSYKNWYESNYTLYVETSVPVTTLNAYSNNKYLNFKNNIDFNCTVEGGDLDSVFLYGNFTGTYLSNQTKSGITTNVLNNFKLNLTDNSYLWTCGANKTNDATITMSQYGNYTVIIDTIYPVTNITSITATAGSQTFNFNSTALDVNLLSCKYSIFDSTGSIDGLNNNVSFTCNSLAYATVTAYGTYNLTVYSKDLANNENSSTKSFTTSASSITIISGGGGGEKELKLSDIFFVLNTNFVNVINLRLAKDSKSPREKTIILLNKGKNPVTLELSCDTTDTNQSSRNVSICDYVKFQNKTIVVSPNEENPTQSSFLLYTPENSDFKENYYFSIVALEKKSNTYSKLSVSSETNLLATSFYKWKYLPFQSDVPDEEKLTYPVFLLALVIGIIILIGSIAIFQRANLILTGLLIGLALFFLSIILITLII